LPYIDCGAYYAVSAWRRFYLGEGPLEL
jgi:hypothetical protein